MDDDCEETPLHADERYERHQTEKLYWKMRYDPSALILKSAEEINPEPGRDLKKKEAWIKNNFPQDYERISKLPNRSGQDIYSMNIQLNYRALLNDLRKKSKR